MQIPYSLQLAQLEIHHQSIAPRAQYDRKSSKFGAYMHSKGDPLSTNISACSAEAKKAVKLRSFIFCVLFSSCRNRVKMQLYLERMKNISPSAYSSEIMTGGMSGIHSRRCRAYHRHSLCSLNSFTAQKRQNAIFISVIVSSLFFSFPMNHKHLSFFASPLGILTLCHEFPG